jgi:hypothetical protein
MKKLIKIGSHILAVTAFAALMVVNVQIGTTDTQAKAVSVPQAEADIIITCGSRNADCFTYDDGTVFIEVRGGVEDIQFEQN